MSFGIVYLYFLLMSHLRTKNAGLTLIELVVVIAVSAVLTGAIALVLKSGVDTYFYSQSEILLEKALDEALDEVGGSGFEGYGIKDALEVLDISPTSITFVPMWVDDSHDTGEKNENTFILNRPLKAGAALPIAEVAEGVSKQTYLPKEEAWRHIPITFIAPENDGPLELGAKVILNYQVMPANKLRFIFQPDASSYPDCAVTISWQDDKIIRRYKADIKTIPAYDVGGVTLSNFNLQYFDSTNTEVIPEKENIPNITAVKVNIVTSLPAGAKRLLKAKSQISKEGFTFINLRNSRVNGKGMLIHNGSRIKIPDSKNVRMFSIANISGIKEAGVIELEAMPEKGPAWKAIIELGLDGKTPLIKKYSIEYPKGNRIYSQTVELATDAPLNFMNLAPAASYGFAGLKDNKKTIKVQGGVELTVTRMDAKGAMLFIRP